MGSGLGMAWHGLDLAAFEFDVHLSLVVDKLCSEYNGTSMAISQMAYGI